MKIKSAHLRTIEHKFVCVQGIWKPKRSHQLVTQNKQESNSGNSGKVSVYHITYDGNRKCMAFGFEVKNKSSLVFPVVTHGEKLEVEVLPTDKPITAGSFDEKFLFQWCGQIISGDWRSLESVAKPKTYLCVEKGKVTITKERVPYFKIKYSDKKKDEESRSSGSDKILENKTNEYKTISFQRRNLKRGSSCCEGSVAPNKPLRCRKTKRIKMSVKS
ncbi:uncharacterized protein LOC131541470 [Onychostoma macrolepis]|uniref:Uncharacterized protein n=1 Tax=Onychostoma macrolepis TaxID=369639 RepID=A0A7J6D0H4_9TELE|nr:uncharacterized protein LOC131541470 [Onychostoma macrolepis]KAF4112716.1 hypothetical protein G5714_005261 [Onychostoma macrolepis]